MFSESGHDIFRIKLHFYVFKINFDILPT